MLALQVSYYSLLVLRFSVVMFLQFLERCLRGEGIGGDFSSLNADSFIIVCLFF